MHMLYQAELIIHSDYLGLEPKTLCTVMQTQVAVG